MSRSENPGPDPDDLRRMIEQFLGDTDNPAMAQAMQQMGIDKLDESTMQMISAQLSALFSTEPTDGINLALCTDLARKTVAAAGDELVNDAQRRAVTEAVGVADLWLEPVTSFSRPGGAVRVWSRAEWVDQTMPLWGRLVSPVATAVTDAITGALRAQLDQLGESGQLPQMPGMPELPGGMGGPGDMSAMLGQLEPMLGRMSSSMFGAQIGQAVGNLAGEVVSGTEVGLPLLPRGEVAMLPVNIAAFAEGLQIDDTQVLLYLCVRETARARLFADVPWLGPQLLAAVEAYAADISVDTDGIEAKLSSIDPMDPEAVQSALAGGLFTPEPSEAQRRALARLETLLALVEGWVDVVAAEATQPHLPQSAALGETVRRRRATGGPAEQLFSRLVGLELRPRRLRDAANLFAALTAAGGAEARDKAWGHPDVAPTSADLDDILGYVERLTGRRPGGPATVEGVAPVPPIEGGDAATGDSGDSRDSDATGSGASAGSDQSDLDDMDAALARLLDEETRGDDPRS